MAIRDLGFERFLRRKGVETTGTLRLRGPYPASLRAAALWPVTDRHNERQHSAVWRKAEASVTRLGRRESRAMLEASGHSG